jgi:hypothetical protein
MRARTASSRARLEGESPPFRARLGKRPGTSGNAFIALKNQQKKRICHVWMLLAKFTGGMLYHARFSSRGVQRDRGHDRHFCVDGEGVEAQIQRWRDSLFYCQQCCPTGRQWHLRGDPSVADRWRRLPIPDQKLDRSFRAGGQGKPARRLLKRSADGQTRRVPMARRRMVRFAEASLRNDCRAQAFASIKCCVRGLRA